MDFLRDGPRAVPEILKHLNVLHVAQVGVQELLRQEVIGKAGLTATDLMHIEGRYSVWDAEAAAMAWKVFCQYQFKDPEALRQQVWTQMGEMIIHAIVTFLSERSLRGYRPGDRERSLGGGDQDFGRWFFYNSLYTANPHLETTIRLRQPMIGIGAPAGIFLPAVAGALHTDLILPQHHEVANAVGAIAGSVMVEEELLVYPKLSRDGLEVLGYYVAVTAMGPVAIDQAAVDLVNQASGRDLFREMWPYCRYEAQLSHAEEIGLGSRSYELVEVRSDQ